MITCRNLYWSRYFESFQRNAFSMRISVFTEMDFDQTLKIQTDKETVTLTMFLEKHI